MQGLGPSVKPRRLVFVFAAALNLPLTTVFQGWNANARGTKHQSPGTMHIIERGTNGALNGALLTCSFDRAGRYNPLWLPSLRCQMEVGTARKQGCLGRFLTLPSCARPPSAA